MIPEALLAGALENSPIGIATTSPDGRFLTVNQALCDLVGYSRSELLTRTFSDLTHSENVGVDRDHVRRMIAGDINAYQVEKRYVHARGHFVTVLLSVTIVRDRSAEPVCFLALIQDISERAHVETALRQSNEKFHQLADNITDAFWIRSPDMTRVEYVSPAFEHIWGRSVASLYANPTEWIEYVVPEDRARVEAVFAALATDAPTLDIEYRIARPSGEVRWLRVRGFQVRDAASHLVRHAGIVTDITERHRADAARDRLAEILESTTDMVSISDPAGHLTYLNRAARRQLGVGAEEDLANIMIADFLPDPSSHPVVTEGIPSAVRQDAWSGETILVNREGKKITVSQVLLAHKSSDGQVEFLSTIMRDITERKRIEGQLFQSQKLETVGKLAGGIAHEFNSILTAIIGQSELLIGHLAGGPLANAAAEINHAAARAARLTRQLLAHGRKQLLILEPVDLNHILASLDGMLHQLMGTDIDTRVVAGPDLRPVQADVGQLEQVIVNLVINARDAMPNGGTLTLETANVTFDDRGMGRDAALASGEYVMLAISDTGHGMSPEVAARAFEPFYTTKAVGHGSGLGLSTSYGIVKQCGGHISLYSDPGRGTTLKIYLPQARQAAATAVPTFGTGGLPRGTETILLVEDEPALRELAATLLRRLGYTVITAADEAEALRLRQQPGAGHIDVLFKGAVLPKPLTPSALAHAVRRALAQGVVAPAAVTG